MIEKKSYLNLLEESFPGIKNQIMRYENLGFSWGSGRLFIKEEKGIPISHVAILECPILIEGRLYNIGALHAICTKSTYRGQGLASKLIQEALQWAKKRYEFVILFTNIPDFYKKLSFQYIQEHRFHLECKHSKGSQSLRPVTAPQDNSFLLKCFNEREPLSNYLWVKDNGIIATFNMIYATYPTYWSLHYSPTINGFISFMLKDKTLHLLDVIANKLPTLDVILDHLPSEIDEIYFYFSPDRFTSSAISEPYLYDNGCLMIHGNLPCTKPFMISPLSRC